MEGLFAFFLESSFLALLVWGERRLGRRGHFAAAVALLIWQLRCRPGYQLWPFGFPRPQGHLVPAQPRQLPDTEDLLRP